jgi:hypothetical protein
MIKAKQERDLFRKQKYGVRGYPKRSDNRIVNKLFDYGRKNAKEAN